MRMQMRMRMQMQMQMKIRMQSNLPTVVMVTSAHHIAYGISGNVSSSA